MQYKQREFISLLLFYEDFLKRKPLSIFLSSVKIFPQTSLFQFFIIYFYFLLFIVKPVFKPFIYILIHIFVMFDIDLFYLCIFNAYFYCTILLCIIFLFLKNIFYYFYHFLFFRCVLIFIVYHNYTTFLHIIITYFLYIF